MGERGDAQLGVQTFDDQRQVLAVRLGGRRRRQDVLGDLANVEAELGHRDRRLVVSVVLRRLGWCFAGACMCNQSINQSIKQSINHEFFERLTPPPK